MKTLIKIILTVLFLSIGLLGSKDTLNQDDNEIRLLSYTVQQWETIEMVADKFNISPYTIKSSNNIYSDNVYYGQRLVLPNNNVTVYKYRPGYTIRRIAFKFYVKIKDVKIFDRSFKLVQDLDEDSKLPYNGYAVVPQLYEKEYTWPCEDKAVISGWGWRRSPFNYRMAEFHTGLDIPSPNKNIYASKSGLIRYSGWLYGYGYAIIILHADNTETLYAHLSNIYFRKGSFVKKGLAIGLTGTTGRSTGNHLHFEVRINGDPVNPYKYLYYGERAEKGRRGYEK